MYTLVYIFCKLSDVIITTGSKKLAKASQILTMEGIKMTNEFDKKDFGQRDDILRDDDDNWENDIFESGDKPGPNGDKPKKKDKGYDSLFLGGNYEVPLPKLSEKQEEDAARMKNGEYVLGYVHFSIAMSKSRGQAYYTAVNIDGNSLISIDRGKDKWIYDPRISEEYQYGNEVYAKNDLDRGHLVRRKDPNWGDKKTAEQANKDTFYFTNSSPQHKDLNQKIWLGLEDYIINNANNHKLKVSVFTGPVFREDDKVYRKRYKLPEEYWKVAVIVKDDGEMSATAYLQSQKYMLGALEFVYGKYETYQVPILKIEEITGLDFGELSKYDPISAIETTGIVISDPEDIRI